MLVFAALAAVMVTARKLGLAAVGGPGGYWWLVRRLFPVWAGASVLYLPFGFVLDPETSVSGQLLAAGTFGVPAVCAVLLAALRQAGLVPRSLAERRRGVLPGLLVLALLSLVTVRVAAGSGGWRSTA